MFGETSDFFRSIALSWSEVLQLVTDFIVSQMGQLLLWGVVTTWMSLYTILSCMVHDQRNTESQKRILVSAAMILVWGTNATLWFAYYFSSDSYYMGLMAYTDTVFSIISLYVFYKYIRTKWMMWLTILFFVTVLIDLGYLSWVGDKMFAILVNAVYGAQLLIVNRWKLPKIRSHSSSMITT